MPRLSVITPTCRGIKELSQLLRDFRNQTMPKDAWEHIIVRDGEPSQEIIDLMKREGNPNTVFCNIPKDAGDMRIAPGTRPRNHGVSIAKGEWLVFADDDDRYKDTYVETLMSGSNETVMAVVQMSCQESRMYKNGNPNRTVLVPEVGLNVFPVVCHMGTPCFTVRREWAVECPWQHEPEHDYRFIKRIVEKFHPQVNFIPGMLVDVDGIVLKGMKDWVSYPPFYR